MEEHRNHRHGRPYGGAHNNAPTEESKKNRKGYRVVFLAVFAGALMAEALLFMRAQIREITLILKEDFRIVVVKSDKVKQDALGMEELFKALPGTSDVSFVSKAERLRRLREEDPDLVGAVMSMAANPLPDTFEIALDEEALGDLNAWVEAAWRVNGVAEVKYKPLEATAILHALFYGHYLLVVLTLAFAALVVMVLMSVFYRNTVAGLIESLRRDRNWLFAGFLAGALAEGVSYALVYPVKYLSPLWLWPGTLEQAAVVAAGGVCAWVIFQWKNTHD
jgi:cell division protein FtsX